MGDKSPKSKDKNKKQDSTKRGEASAAASKKQAANAPPKPVVGKK